MTIYLVMFDWSTEDDSDVEAELFDTYDKAYNRFNEIIAREMNPGYSWICEAFNANGTLKEGYNFDSETNGSEQTNLWWNIAVNDDRIIHAFLDLKCMNVK